MVKTGCFTPGDLKELFDKHVFLYYEEKILGQKLKQMGLKELLVTDAYYVHAHSVSIDKSYTKISDKQKLLHKSKLYYYQHYRSKISHRCLEDALVMMDNGYQDKRESVTNQRMAEL